MILESSDVKPEAQPHARFCHCQLFLSCEANKTTNLLLPSHPTQCDRLSPYIGAIIMKNHCTRWLMLLYRQRLWSITSVSLTHLHNRIDTCQLLGRGRLDPENCGTLTPSLVLCRTISTVDSTFELALLSERRGAGSVY